MHQCDIIPYVNNFVIPWTNDVCTVKQLYIQKHNHYNDIIMKLGLNMKKGNEMWSDLQRLTYTSLPTDVRENVAKAVTWWDHFGSAFATFEKVLQEHTFGMSTTLEVDLLCHSSQH